MSKWQVFNLYLVHGARMQAEMAKGGFRLACLALQNAKTGHMEMKITQPIFGSFDEKTNLPKCHEINIYLVHGARTQAEMAKVGFRGSCTS